LYEYMGVFSTDSVAELTSSFIGFGGRIAEPAFAIRPKVSLVRFSVIEPNLPGDC
jgi:hypothetical protein